MRSLMDYLLEQNRQSVVSLSGADPGLDDRDKDRAEQVHTRGLPSEEGTT